MDNSKVKACRVCLNTDVKLFHIDNIIEYYISLLVTNENYMLFPNYICYECTALLEKYINFRQKYIVAQSLLSNILEKYDEITEEQIKDVNMSTLALKSYLIHQKLPSLSVPDENGSEIEMTVDETTEYLEDNVDEGKLEEINFVVGDTKSYNVLDEEKEQLVDDMILEESSIAYDIKETMNSELRPADVRTPKRGRPRKEPSETDPWAGIDLDKYVTVTKLTLEEQIEEINKRQQTSNYINSPFKCNLCYKGFLTKDSCRNHAEKHDLSAGNVECPVCKFRFKKDYQMKKHAANHEVKYFCKTCPNVSKNPTQARKHQGWHKGVLYKCPHCELLSIKWTSHLNHLRNKHPSEFICEVCGYSFVSKMGLAQHRSARHKGVSVEVKAEDGDDEGLYCVECDVKFVSEVAWKRHMVTSVRHTPAAKHNSGCRVCGESFETAQELKIHRKAHSIKRSDDKPVKNPWPTNCKICSEQIFNPPEYRSHMKQMHLNENDPITKNYVCDECGRSFRCLALLSVHKHSHAAERRFTCGACRNTFCTRGRLQLHRRRRACRHGDSTLKGKHALDALNRNDSGVKPYMCEMCGKSFVTAAHLNGHMRTVHLSRADTPRATTRATTRATPRATSRPTDQT